MPTMYQPEEPSSWYDQAECKVRNVDPEIFFADNIGRVAEKAIRDEFCINCPVRVECLTTAIENREQYGIWGGYKRLDRVQYIRLLKQGHVPAYAIRQLDRKLDNDVTLATPFKEIQDYIFYKIRCNKE